MKLITRLVHRMNVLRVCLLNRLEPKTWVQLHIWAKIYRATDLSYLVNYLESYLEYGVIWKNTLFRDYLVRRRYNV